MSFIIVNLVICMIFVFENLPKKCRYNPAKICNSFEILKSFEKVFSNVQQKVVQLEGQIYDMI